MLSLVDSYKKIIKSTKILWKINVTFKKFPSGKFSYLLSLHCGETLSSKDLPIANVKFRWIKMKLEKDTKVAF